MALTASNIATCMQRQRAAMHRLAQALLRAMDVRLRVPVHDDVGARACDQHHAQCECQPRLERRKHEWHLPLVLSVMITAFERQQEMIEGPVRHAPALGARRDVRETEVDSQVDARVDDVPRGIREAVVLARSFAPPVARGS